MVFEYKAKEVFKGEWIYGDLIRTSLNNESTTSYKINNQLVNMNTISLYLNYKDIFGNKIYNYDIIKVNDKNNYLIFYDENQCSFCLLKLDELSIKLFKNNLQVISFLPDKHWWKKNNIKIVGNLFDNEDLLYGLTYNNLVDLHI